MKSPMARIVWFYGTWFVLVFRAIFILAFLLLMLTVGVLNFASLRIGGVFLGLVYLLIVAGLSYLFLGEIRKFRSDVRSGMQSELKRRHLCPHCAYDLRKSVETCPECGYQILKTIEL